MTKETSTITVSHSLSRIKTSGKYIICAIFVKYSFGRKKNTPSLAQVNQLGMNTVKGKRGGKDFHGLSAVLISCQDGTYDISVCSPSPPPTGTQSLSKALPERQKILFIPADISARGRFSIHRSERACRGKGKTNGTCRAWGSRCRRDIFKKWGKGERERERMLKGTRFENSLGQYRDSTAANVHTHTERCKNPTTGEKQTSINKDARISACTAHARSPKHNAGV